MALVSVVVPVYFNAESLPVLMKRFESVAEAASEDDFEFIFVDDGSGDNSFQVLRNLAKEDKRVRVIKLSRNFGSNAAILAGLTYSRGDCAAIISADLQDPPELISQFVEQWRRGNKVVLASRRSRNDPLVSRIFARLFNYLFHRFVSRDFPVGGFDFMLIDRCVIDILVTLQEKNSYIFGQTIWVGFKRQVVYYDRLARGHGRSHWTTAKKIKYFVDAFTAFSYLPLRAASLLGILLAGLGFLYALFIVGLRLARGAEIPGWSSLTAIVLVTSGVQLVLVGILGEYLWRTLDESRQRPPFIVESVVGLDPDPATSSQSEATIGEGTS